MVNVHQELEITMIICLVDTVLILKGPYFVSVYVQTRHHGNPSGSCSDSSVDGKDGARTAGME